MSEVILFRPKAELDAAENLIGFVESCRDHLTVFGKKLPFDENVWDITESLNLKGHGNKRDRLVFSTLKTMNEKVPTPMAEPFLSFSKAYLRYMQGLRPTKIIAFRLSALRALDAALSENGEVPDPIRTDAGALNRAAQLIGEHYTEGVAYRVGGQLEMIAAFLAENRLTIIPVRWRNHTKRPVDTIRVGREFDERRKAKLPSQTALDALPKIFRLAVDSDDVIASSVAALLCSAPDRISEVLLLPEACEVRQKIGKNKGEAYGLRWWPAKGAEPMVKWLVPSMADVAQEAIEKIRRITEPARRIAKWYENHPKHVYLEPEFEYLRGKEWISMKEVGLILGFAHKTAPGVWCKSNKLMKIKRDGLSLVRFSDVQDTVVGMLPAGFPLLDKDTDLKYSDALLLVFTNELHRQRGNYRCMIEPININHINSRFGGRAQYGFDSIFAKFGFAEPDGKPIKVTTHQFRHYLNTIAQEGGMSQLDIAKWSGRKDIRQNAAYDHVTPDQMLQKIRNAVGDENQMFGPLVELPKRVPISRDEFARLKVPTAHTTDLGYCIHDYTMSPCQLHMDCINCQDLVCIKGDEEKTKRLRLRLKEARELQEQALQAKDKGYAGSDRWLEHHSLTVERLSQLCSIMDDPKVSLGSVVQLSPPTGKLQIGKEAKNLLTAPDEQNPSELLIDGVTSMEA